MKLQILAFALFFCNLLFPQTHDKLPNTIGPHHVSSIGNIYLSDTTRIERASNGKKTRKINFDLFYPSDHTSPQRITYWPNRELYTKVLDSLQITVLGREIKTNSSVLGKISQKRENYPLVLFSPGWQATRFEFTILVEHLASLGNIVAILDHPYMCNANINGKLTEPTDHGFTSYEDFRDYLGADQLLVLRFLQKQNDDSNSMLYGRIDPEKVISIGQSTGFLATKGASLKESAISKCVSLDAALGKKNELDQLKQDILLLALERVKLSDGFDLKRNVVQLFYEDAGHFSTADWTFLKPPKSLVTPEVGAELLANYAQNIHLFIHEGSLNAFVKKVSRHPNLITRSFNGE